MSRKTAKPANEVRIDKTVYAMQDIGADEAEIRMYGEIVTTRPYDFWTGEEIKGEFIVKDEFLDDLKLLQGRKKINLHMDSIGGEVLPALTIHNLIRDMENAGTEFWCYVDGAAMSAATVIMCACSHVVVSATSLLMIHKAGAFLCDFYNADDLRKEADSFDAYDEAIINAYKRKTGLSETVLSHMMSETFYMTGEEAKEKGFADVLKEGEGDPFGLLTASANGLILFSNGHALRADGHEPLPEQIKRINAEGDGTIIQNHETENLQKGTETMTLEDLKRDNPELVAQIEAEAVSTSEKTAADAVAKAVADAVAAERVRLHDIDKIASLFAPDLVDEAKYGTPCTAQELSYRAAQEAAAKGNAFLASAMADAKASGAAEVTSAPEPETKEAETPEDKMNEARTLVNALFNKKKGE